MHIHRVDVEDAANAALSGQGDDYPIHHRVLLKHDCPPQKWRCTARKRCYEQLRALTVGRRHAHVQAARPDFNDARSKSPARKAAEPAAEPDKNAEKGNWGGADLGPNSGLLPGRETVRHRTAQSPERTSPPRCHPTRPEEHDPIPRPRYLYGYT